MTMIPPDARLDSEIDMFKFWMVSSDLEYAVHHIYIYFNDIMFVFLL